jgi:type VI secretion system protein ImpJ
LDFTKPVYWHQGLFLQPHHFQQQELYLKSDFSFFTGLILPYPWGIKTYELNKESLKNNIIELDFGEFIFQDTTIASFPKNAAAVPRVFDPLKINQDKPEKIYLGIKKMSQSSINAHQTENSENLNETFARFVIKGIPDEVKDLYSKGSEAQIEKMTYLLKFYFESELENLQNYCFFPIAVIEKQGDNIYYKNDFIPPLINISASEKIFKLVYNLKESISARARQLEEYKNPLGMKKSSFTTEYFIYLMALQTLNRHLPLLNNVLKFSNLHPWTLYNILCQIAGELSSFSTRINCLGETKIGTKLILEYDHENLWEIYSQISKLILELLDEIIIGPEHIIFLERNEDEFFAEIKEDIFDGQNLYFLIVKTSEDKNILIKNIKNIAKLSSKQTMDILVARALPGIEMINEPSPPYGIPGRPDSTYFKINHLASLFKKVKHEKNICLYFEGAPKDMRCELIVIKGE